MLEITPGAEDAFAEAYRQVRHEVADTPGCRSMRMTRGVESPSRFVLLVEWDSVEAHEVDFRASERFGRWRAGDRPALRRAAAGGALRRHRRPARRVASVGGVKPADLALLRVARPAHPLPGRDPRGRRGEPSRPRRRRVPLPPVAGGHHRCRAAAAADRGTAGRRAGLVAGRAVDRVPARAGPDGKPQLHLLPADVGDARQVTTDEQHPLGAGAPRWSPDSTRLAYSARVPEQGRYGTEEGRGAGEGAAAPDHHAATSGWTTSASSSTGGRTCSCSTRSRTSRRRPRSPRRLRGRPGQLDAGRAGCCSPATVTHRSNTNLHWDVYACAADGSDLRRLTRGGTGRRLPGGRPDGGTVFYLAVSDLGPDAPRLRRPQRRAVVGRRPTARPPPTPAHRRRRPTSVDRSATGWSSTATACWPRPAGAAARSCSGCRWPAASPEVVVGGARTVTRRGGRRRADRRHRRRTRSAPARCSSSAGDEPLTDFGAELTAGAPAAADAGADRDRAGRLPGARLAGAPRPGPARRTAPGAAGHPRRPVHAQYGYTLFDEAQVYADAGYAVVLGNPRGAAGYGEEHGRAIRHRLGTRGRRRPAGPARRGAGRPTGADRDPGRRHGRLVRRLHDRLAGRARRRPVPGRDRGAGGHRRGTRSPGPATSGSSSPSSTPAPTRRPRPRRARWRTRTRSTCRS